MHRLVFGLLLVSCAPYQTLEQLEDAYMACIKTDADCTEAEEAFDARKRRIERRMPCDLCPKDMIDFHNDTGHAGCLTRGQLRDILW